MQANTEPVARPRPADLVTRHKCFRGLKVEENLLASFTMYIVELDQFGLFISDSRPEAFNMAFEALFSDARTGGRT